MKLLYKPYAIVFGVLGGLIARKIFEAVWARVDDEGVPPTPMQKEFGWPKVLAGAAVEGVIYSVVKAAVSRGGAQGIEALTGTWPAETAEDLAKEKADRAA
jgi:hypothetical protein